MPSPPCSCASGVSGRDPHSCAHGRDARAHDAPVGLHAAFLADADAAVEPARIARRTRAQRLATGGEEGGADALAGRGPQRLPVDAQLNHETASAAGAKRSGENHSIGSGDGSPACQAATSSPVAGARPMPAPSWPVATHTFGASANGPTIGT